MHTSCDLCSYIQQYLLIKGFQKHMNTLVRVISKFCGNTNAFFFFFGEAAGVHHRGGSPSPVVGSDLVANTKLRLPDSGPISLSPS